MDKQVSLSGLSDELAQVRTKKKEFLSQIERIVPWGEWLTLIRPCYYKGERGNKPYDLERMLRIYLLQNLYDLADEAVLFAADDQTHLGYQGPCSQSAALAVPKPGRGPSAAGEGP